MSSRNRILNASYHAIGKTASIQDPERLERIAEAERLGFGVRSLDTFDMYSLNGEYIETSFSGNELMFFVRGDKDLISPYQRMNVKKFGSSLDLRGKFSLREVKNFHETLNRQYGNALSLRRRAFEAARPEYILETTHWEDAIILDTENVYDQRSLRITIMFDNLSNKNVEDSLVAYVTGSEGWNERGMPLTRKPKAVSIEDIPNVVKKFVR